MCVFLVAATLAVPSQANAKVVCRIPDGLKAWYTSKGLPWAFFTPTLGISPLVHYPQACSTLSASIDWAG
jgi:hypothetical protein